VDAAGNVLDVDGWSYAVGDESRVKWLGKEGGRGTALVRAVWVRGSSRKDLLQPNGQRAYAPATWSISAAVG
jgi:hypothetical protein